MNPVDKLMVKARTGLLLDEPFFGQLALRLNMVADPSLPTAATDGKRLRYNPAWIAELGLSRAKTLWGHEVLHVALGHHRRRGNRDTALWNSACDHVVNLILEESGFTLATADAPADPQFAGQSAEAVYRVLSERQQPGDGEDDGKPQDGQGGQQGPQAGPQRQQPDPNGDPVPDDGTGQGDDHGTEPTPDPGGCGAVEDAPGDGPQDRAEEQIATAQAAQSAKARGRLPGALARTIEEIVSPPLDWRAVLADFVDRAARNDYTWRRPNPRYAGTGFILPTLHSERLTVAVAVDTSCSISPAVLAGFAEQLRGILDSYPDTEATVIYCDARVQHVETYAHGDEIRLECHGGGGTDFRPVFDWLDEQGDDPACLVYLTDLYGPAPDHEPEYPVLWAATTDREAPWGETVRLR